MIDMLSQGWVGSVIGLIGVVLAVLGLLAYRVSRIGPRPTFQLQSRRLIGKQEQELPGEVEVLFNKQPVPRLTLSRIVFWNSGNLTINGDAVVDADPLRLEVEDGSILKAHVVKTTRAVTNFTVGSADIPTKAILTFDFLDPADGAVLEILHTSKKQNPRVLGTIRGVPKGIASLGDFSGTTPPFFPSRTRNYARRITKIIVFAMVLIGVLVMIYATLPEHWVRAINDALKSKDAQWSFGIGKRIGFLFLGAIYALPPVMLFWLRRRRFPRSLQIEE